MTETLELEPDAFWRMVTEERLQTDGPSAGFMWTGKRGKDGWEVYKTRAQPIGWLYQARRVNTQSNVAGGLLQTRIIIPSGVVAKLVQFYAAGPVTNTTLSVGIVDEDAATVSNLTTVAAGVSRVWFGPTQSGAASTHNVAAHSVGMMVGPGQIITVTAGAAAQTETLTVFTALLMSANVAPTWDTTGSAGTPSLAASTISVANTMQAVYL